MLLLVATFLAATVSLFAAEPNASAAPFVSPLFGDNMVLQRGKPNALWGWAKPGDAVRVEIQGVEATGIAAADGRWQVLIAVPPVGGPYAVSIHGPGEARTFHNVLVGDVWLCGGQSNMFLGVGGTRNGAEEIKAGDHPDIHFFVVGQRPAYEPSKVPDGSWKVCTPTTLAEGSFGGFSAVAYFFARRVQADVHVPLGLIEDCVGGSTAEAWMSASSLTSMGEFRTQVAAMEKLRAAGGPQYGSFLMHWLDDYDVGSKGDLWSATDYADASWETAEVPGLVQTGVRWFRRTVTLPDPLPAGTARIYLGSIDKMDTTYINGQWVGASSWVENPRTYDIGPSVLKPGRNVVAIRVFATKPNRGFLAKPAELRIGLGNGVSVPLAGAWKSKLSVDARPPHPMPLDVENYPTMPAVFYEGMIAPLAPLALTGVLWYQGEANAIHAVQYRKLLPGLIADWRSLFAQGDIPFYVVSLPAFTARKAEPGDDGWAELREAQAMTVRRVPNTALAVTIDTGEADNIHPKDKKVVGDRLALCALAAVYKVPVVSSGPVYSAMDVLPGSLRLHFRGVDGGLAAHGPKLGEFSVAGNDRVWRWADARIDGDTVIVSSPAVPNPAAARYAWQSNPLATLYNGAGLPACPFRTDAWDFVSN